MRAWLDEHIATISVALFGAALIGLVVGTKVAHLLDDVAQSLNALP